MVDFIDPKMGSGICMVCGAELKNNLAEIPEAMKVTHLLLEGYSQHKIEFHGPDQWICYKCIRKIMKNVIESTEKFNNLA